MRRQQDFIRMHCTNAPRAGISLAKKSVVLENKVKQRTFQTRGLYSLESHGENITIYPNA